jgi:hypothetical protein
MDSYSRFCNEAILELNDIGAMTTPDNVRLKAGIKKALSVDKFITLRELLKGNEGLQRKLSSKSYFHENGFFKLTVVDSPAHEYKVRLHYWPLATQSRLTAQNIHNHRFSCVSYLLHGGLRNRIWKIDETGDQFYHYKYYPRLAQEFYTLAFDRKCSLTISEERQYSTDDLYRMSPDDLHTADVDLTRSLVTLFIAEKFNLKPFADVFSNRYLEKDVPLAARSLEPYQYSNILNEILCVLGV